jgi:hypothetical protein
MPLIYSTASETEIKLGLLLDKRYHGFSPSKWFQIERFKLPYP